MVRPGVQERRTVDAERRLELLIDSVREYAIFMIDPTGHIETWNLGAKLIKGYEPAEIIGKHIECFYGAEDRAACKPGKLLARARAEGRVEDEGWRVRKDGTRFWADVVLTAVHDANGELVGFLKVTRDLTDRMRAERLRLQHEQRFRALVESATDYAIFMLDPTGHVTTWNEGAQRIKNYTPAEIIGQHFSRFYSDEDVRSGKCERELETALRDGRYEDEGWRLRKDGSRFWANVVIAPLRDDEGTHIGFSKVTRDLTDRHAAELDRLELARVQEALRLRDEFLSIASHELRTPLAALQLQIESLAAQAEGFGPKLRSKLDRADRNVQRLSQLIDTLLDVSRIARGQLALSTTRFDLGDLVSEVIDQLQESAGKAACPIEAILEPGIVGSWDPLRIGQVVTNLLSNAFSYAPRARITVSLRRGGGDMAVLRIEDRGPGIDAGQLERIFGRFERATLSASHAGLGLGLYVAREIATAHAGTIQAFNREGGGASFELRLPVRGDHQSPEELTP